MGDKYFKARKEFEWKRNPQWPSIPVDDDNNNKIYMIYAVIEDNPNQLGVTVREDSIINWGDGASTTQTISSFTTIHHTYNYATVVAPILQLPDGRNYKPVLFEGIIEPSYYFYLGDIAPGFDGTNNVLECVSYLGDGVSVTGSDSSRLLFGNNSFPVLMEHVKIKSPNDDNVGDMFRYAKSIKKMELPTNFFHSGLTSIGLFGRSASFNGHNFGNININDNAPSFFSYADSFIIGDIVFGAATTTINSMCIHSNNYAFGGVSGPNVNNATYAFGGTVNNGANSIGLIDLPALTNSSNMFRRSQMPEVEFVNCANITDADDMFRDCFSIQKIIMPGLTRGVSVQNNLLTEAAINAFFTSLGTASGSQTINVSNNPGAATCDTTIATGKGFTVIT